MPSRKNSPKRTQKKKSRTATPPPRKGETREKSDVYFLSQAYKTLKGKELSNFVKNMIKGRKGGSKHGTKRNKKHNHTKKHKRTKN